MGYAPTSFMDLDEQISGETLPDADEIEAFYDTAMSAPAKVGIKVNSAKNGPYIDANVSVGAKEAGTYQIGLFLVEDNIVDKQMMDTGVYDDNYNHTDVLRAAAAKDKSIFGEELGSFEVGDVISKDFRFTIASNYKAKNLALVAYVLYEKKDGEWVIANSVKAPAEGVVDYKYAE
jgi:hypothetical protein